MNKLMKICVPGEVLIRQKYKAAILDMQNCLGIRDEDKWNEFCDQDQLYYLAYEVVPEIEDQRDLDVGCHNQLTDWLNALFSVEAAVLDFDGSV